MTRSRKITLLARLALAGLSVASLAIALIIALSGRLADMSLSAAVSVCAVLVGTMLAAGITSVRLGPSGAVRVTLELASIGVALLAAEAATCAFVPEPGSTQQERKLDADRLGLAFDLRTRSEVVAEMRDRGIDAMPGISREWPRLPRVRQQLPEGLYPLSDASNADVVECNESGHYLVFHSDDFGFNNPAGLIASGDVDVAAVGASFTLGHCVDRGMSVVAQLRRSYPKLANLGIAGSGTLSMLATFREYVEPLKPPLVLWIMHPWTADTRDELGDPLLARYLEPDFSQHLIERRQEIDRAWRDIAVQVQYEFDRRVQLAVAQRQQQRYAGILTLSQLRKRLHLNEQLARPAAALDLSPFRRTVDLARRTTEGWGGRFVVVIMPLYAEVVAHDLAEPLRHDHLAAMLRAMGVTVIDTVPTFLDNSDPASLYVMRRNNHPTAEGHRLLARYIATELRTPAPAARLAVQRDPP